MPSSVLLQAAVGGIGILLVLLLLVIGITLVVWTYRDAQTNSSHPEFLWALVVFLAPLLGIVLYLIMGRDER
jgi:glucose uptake protein GlcU